MKILVINSGSSSLKYQLIDMETEGVLAKGLCERIGIANSNFIYKAKGQTIEQQIDMPSHNVAVKLVLDKLTDKEVGVIKSMKEIDGVHIGVVGHCEVETRVKYEYHRRGWHFRKASLDAHYCRRIV